MKINKQILSLCIGVICTSYAFAGCTPTGKTYQGQSIEMCTNGSFAPAPAYNWGTDPNYPGSVCNYYNGKCNKPVYVCNVINGGWTPTDTFDMYCSN